MGFCLLCGDLLAASGKCNTCSKVDAMAIINGTAPKPSKKRQAKILSGKSSLPYGLRGDVRRNGKGTTST